MGDNANDSHQVLADWRRQRAKDRKDHHTSVISIALATPTPPLVGEENHCGANDDDRHPRAATSLDQAKDGKRQQQRSSKSTTPSSFSSLHTFRMTEARLKAVRADFAHRKEQSQAYYQHKLSSDVRRVNDSLRRHRQEHDQIVEETAKRNRQQQPAPAPQSSSFDPSSSSKKGNNQKQPFRIEAVRLPVVRHNLFTITPRKIHRVEDDLLKAAMKEYYADSNNSGGSSNEQQSQQQKGQLINQQQQQGQDENDQALVLFDPMVKAQMVSSKHKKNAVEHVGSDTRPFATNSNSNNSHVHDADMKKKKRNQLSRSCLPPIDDLLRVSNRVYESNQRCMGSGDVGKKKETNPFGSYGNPPTYWERLQIYSLFVQQR